MFILLRHVGWTAFLFSVVGQLPAQEADKPEFIPLDFEITIDTILEHDGGLDHLVSGMRSSRAKADLKKSPQYDPEQFFWYHARATRMPGYGHGGDPSVLLTLQKHLS